MSVGYRTHRRAERNEKKVDWILESSWFAKIKFFALVHIPAKRWVHFNRLGGKGFWGHRQEQILLTTETDVESHLHRYLCSVSIAIPLCCSMVSDLAIKTALENPKMREKEGKRREDTHFLWFVSPQNGMSYACTCGARYLEEKIRRVELQKWRSKEEYVERAQLEMSKWELRIGNWERTRAEFRWRNEKPMG